MTFTIHGLGLALPEHRLTQAETLALARAMWASSADHDRALGALYRRSGPAHRAFVLDASTGAPLRAAGRDERHVPTTGERMAAYERLAPPLAHRAAAAALSDARVDAEAITHVVTVSCTGASAPGVDVALVESLGLRRTVARTHVGFMGCYGALSGLRVAHAFAAADPEAVVLVCCVELCSLHFHYGDDAERTVANALFADGAAAVVGRAAARADAWRVIASGSALLPASVDAMRWTIRDHGFAMALSARVPDAIERELAAFVDSWLDGVGLRRRDVRSFALHPGGPRILDAVARALELRPEDCAASRAALAEHGNLSSPTVLFVLDRLRRARAPSPCLALAFGPGLVVEAALLERS